MENKVLTDEQFKIVQAVLIKSFIEDYLVDVKEEELDFIPSSDTFINKMIEVFGEYTPKELSERLLNTLKSIIDDLNLEEKSEENSQEDEQNEQDLQD